MPKSSGFVPPWSCSQARNRTGSPNDSANRSTSSVMRIGWKVGHETEPESERPKNQSPLSHPGQPNLPWPYVQVQHHHTFTTDPPRPPRPVYAKVWVCCTCDMYCTQIKVFVVGWMVVMCRMSFRRTHDTCFCCMLRDSSCRVAGAGNARPFGPVGHFTQPDILQPQLLPQSWIKMSPTVRSRGQSISF